MLLAEFVSPEVGIGAVLALVIFTLASMWIGWLANKATRDGAFMQGFFLGNRGLGAWALALTATVQSGGTFMGFPSLVYSHGWTVALWIAGYMAVPITGFGFLGKRLAQLSRRTRAITVPDMFRARFNSPALGLMASLFILFYMSFMMVAQFKAGAIVMKLAWPGGKSLALAEDAAYQLDEPALKSLTSVPEATRAKLKPLIAKSFSTEREFSEAVEQQLGGANSEELKAHRKAIVSSVTPLDRKYIIGLCIFSLTVVGYTLLGGFLAAVWTDLFQSIMMFVGVLFLLGLVLNHVWNDPEIGSLENASRVAVNRLEKSALSSSAGSTTATAEQVAEARSKAEKYVFCPGFDPSGKGNEFLPLGVAASFFFVWVFAGVSSPAGMVRVMASESTGVIRRSIYLLSIYNAFIYLPLIVICICGRAILHPGLAPNQSDEIIPRLALGMTGNIPYVGSFLGGLILAAPFGAVMATVSSYLVVLSSGLVRDVYQRFIRPEASQHELRRLSYISMVLIGVIAVVAVIRPVDYLQSIVVFSGTGAGATFCIPAFMLAFWRRANIAGTMSAMATGAATIIGLYIAGFMKVGGNVGAVTSFRPFYPLNLDPLIWGMAASFVVGVTVTLVTAPPEESLVSKLFDAQSDNTATA